VATNQQFWGNINMGDYVHFDETLTMAKRKIGDWTNYVLRDNLGKSKKTV